MISQEELKRLLHYDPITGIFTRLVATARRSKVGEIANFVNNCGYVIIGLKGKPYTGHRLAWLYVYGDMPKEIDHINRIRNDNRIANLRSVSRKQNMENSSIRKDNKSGFKGVSLHKGTGKWRAQIKHEGMKMHLGYFDNPELASGAYLAAVSKLFTHQQGGAT